MPRALKLCPAMRTFSGGGIGLQVRCGRSTPGVSCTRRDAVVAFCERVPV